MFLTSILFALMIAVLSAKMFYPKDTIIFSKKILFDKMNQKIGFRILNLHSEPLINPDIRIHYSEHCIGNEIAKIATLNVPVQLVGYLGKHDYTCMIEVSSEFMNHLENAVLLEKDESQKVKSRFRVFVSISGNNGIQEIVQVNRYYPKNFTKGTKFKPIQYNETERKNIVNYLRFGNFKEDFECVIQ
jgi:hypothetical protein